MRRAVLSILSTIAGLVLLLTFKTQAMPAATPVAGGTSGSTSVSGSSSSSSSSTSTSTGSTGSTSTGSGSGSGTKTVTGASENTRYGPVQVRITVVNGKITAAQAVAYPQNNGRDQEINSTAIPQLNSEAVAAGSASIDMVSGATYTSEGYISSLQSALDQVK